MCQVWFTPVSHEKTPNLATSTHTGIIYKMSKLLHNNKSKKLNSRFLQIVHFKRFQLVQGRWIKSHKAVDFPFNNLNITKYLADVPRRTAEFGQDVSNVSNQIDESLKPLQDFHQHRLIDDANPFALDYRLYAIVVCFCFNLSLYVIVIQITL